MNPKIYTSTELAEILGVTSETIRREIKRNRLKCFYVGNEARFTQVHIEEYMNIKNFGMTEREMELVAEKEKLIEVIAQKDKVIENIKDFILKEVQ